MLTLITTTVVALLGKFMAWAPAARAVHSIKRRTSEHVGTAALIGIGIVALFVVASALKHSGASRVHAEVAEASTKALLEQRDREREINRAAALSRERLARDQRDAVSRAIELEQALAAAAAEAAAAQGPSGIPAPNAARDPNPVIWSREIVRGLRK
jgi:threonine dehydrogenase-like Zn-dependent dehydrogenase